MQKLTIFAAMVRKRKPLNPFARDRQRSLAQAISE